MKKIYEKPMTHNELVQRYNNAHNLVLFSARIDKDLVDKLKLKLLDKDMSQKEFIVKAIQDFIDE